MTPFTLTASDLPAAAELLARVGLSGASTMLRRYLRWQPDGVWKLEIDGALAGMVTLLHQGSVGFVGCMAVDPARQGAGLGRRLLEHAHREGRRPASPRSCSRRRPPANRCIAGSATSSSTSPRSSRGTARPSPRDGATVAAAPKIAAADLMGIVALGRKATGCDRAVMIGSLIESFAGAVIRNGEVLDGYAVAIGDRLGPVIASTTGGGCSLVERFAPDCATAVASLANPVAVAALTASGFTEAHPLRRMRLGPPITARPDWVWTLASPGAG